jgi:hypothetical protein
MVDEDPEHPYAPGSVYLKVYTPVISPDAVAVFEPVVVIVAIFGVVPT